MTVDLTTTNVLLGIMAFVSLLQALAVVGAMVAGVLVYRKMIQVIAAIEERQVAPVTAKASAILDDVKAVTKTVREGTERVEWLAEWLFRIADRWRRRPGDDVSAGRTDRGSSV